MKHITLLYDAGELFDADLFNIATLYFDPDQMLESSIIYYLYSEEFHSEELRESISVESLMNKDFDEEDAKQYSVIADDLLNNWIDDFYMKSGDYFEKLTKEKDWIFVSAKYVVESGAVLIRFRKRKPKEPYTYL